MSDGLKALLEALYKIGNDDIYTESWEYRSRVLAMGALIGLLGRFLKGERLTQQKVNSILEISKLDL